MIERSYGGAYYLEWEKIYESYDEVRDRKDPCGERHRQRKPNQGTWQDIP